MNNKRGFGHITVDGVQYPIRFSTNQTQYFCELEDCDLKGYNDLFRPVPTGEKDEQGNPTFTNAFSQQTVKPSTLKHLIYSGLKEGARVAKTDLTVSLEDVGDLIDLMDATAWRNVSHLIILKEEAPSPNDTPKEEPLTPAAA